MKRYSSGGGIGEFFLNLFAWIFILPIVGLYQFFRGLLRDVSKKVYVGLVAIIASTIVYFIVRFVISRVT